MSARTELVSSGREGSALTAEPSLQPWPQLLILPQLPKYWIGSVLPPHQAYPGELLVALSEEQQVTSEVQESATRRQNPDG